MAKPPAPAWVKPAALGGCLLLLTILSGSRLGPLPAPARFFNPFSGFWRNAEAGGIQGGELRLQGLRQPVSVAFDTRGVPHLFAQNSHDLHFAQGYVTARDRLWQMEVQTHAAAGRLAEFLGPALVERDRHVRRLGLARGAERDLELMKARPESREAIEAYSAGVNAWIASLDAARLPLEYKLLGYLPEPWTPFKSALLIKNMQWTLSGSGDDLPLSNTRGKFGETFMARFFPARDSTLPPVIPAGTPWTPPRDTAPPPLPPTLLPGDTAAWPDPAQGPGAVPSGAEARDTGRAGGTDSAPHPVPPARPDPGNGSNSFVVSGARTGTGSPILANDPHLDLALPSLWYEIQLAAPGLNAYGVSLAGLPSLVIGFNRAIAWGLTNGNDDVFDWYRIEFKDASMEEYLHDGNWRPTRRVLETIRVRGGDVVVDTVYYTHHGPVVLKSREKPRTRNVPARHALRWLALDGSDALEAFLRLPRAGNHAEFLAAIRDFACPAQNFAFASATGDIAMAHQGRFPRKWKGQGRLVLSGAEPGHDWQGWVPEAENPRVRNPAQGWLASANQQPTDTSYPHELGSGFFQGRRSARLAQLVADADSLTPEDARDILLDDLDPHAAAILPGLLQRLDARSFSAADSAARDTLAAWDFRCRPGRRAPALFDLWWNSLYRAIWQDEFAGDTARYQWPGKERTRRLILEEPREDWFDDVTTPTRETLGALVNRSFREARARHVRMGSPDWAGYRPVAIRHLAGIDALGRLGISTGGCRDCVNALRPGHGPSWRMVVALGRQGPRAWGIYPGGQSGNPGSPRYDMFVDDWAEGRLHPLLFLAAAGDRPEETPVRLFLEGK